MRDKVLQFREVNIQAAYGVYSYKLTRLTHPGSPDSKNSFKSCKVFAKAKLKLKKELRLKVYNHEARDITKKLELWQ